MENCLYYGDNLEILRRYINDESIDLIYLDPPFNSKASYNMLFDEHDGTKSAAQFRAFEDTWSWDEAAVNNYQDVVERDGKIGQTLASFRSMLGDTDMLAYLSMMANRLIELRRVLKPNGSIFLHCDPTASHYIKLLLDAIFGVKNFVNEIVWQKIRTTKSQTIGFGKVHDIIFFYSKSDRPKFTTQFKELDPHYISSHYREDPVTGRMYRTVSMLQKGQGSSKRFGEKELAPPPGRHWIWSQERIDKAMEDGLIKFTSNGRPEKIQYLDEMEGDIVDDLWTDIFPINSQAKEALGYPTQKPEALLERIIQCCTSEGDTILDPFCGCGTAIITAQSLKRNWIGIDITYLAIAVMKQRLHDAFLGRAEFSVIGEPTSVEDAQALADSDPYQFQWWALGLIGARPLEEKKGADKGIDGRLYFHEVDGGETKQIIFSVKAGKTNSAHVRDLHGTIDREGAAIGVLLTMQPPTKPMRSEAASGGIYRSPWGDHPKLQILTVEDLLEGKKIDMPPVHQVNVTYKRASTIKKKIDKQPDLFLNKK